MDTKNVGQMTVEELRAVPFIKWDQSIVCAALVIVPTGKLHDSGYGTMSFVAQDNEGKPMGQMGGCSDAIHLDGIGGYGPRCEIRADGKPPLIPVSGWFMDCLPVSGCLRLMARASIKTDVSVSDFRVYSVSAKDYK